jgi:glycosyltransferase involved in cell wall biosynthesis
MSPPIIYDGLRLFLGALSHTPRGVDRVDYSYARFLFQNWPGPCLGLLPTPWGTRLYDRDQALKMLSTVKARWREDQLCNSDRALHVIKEWLSGVSAISPVKPAARQSALLSHGFKYMRENGIHLGQSAVKRAPEGSIYINVGQVGWAAPAATRWLSGRKDIRAVFMLHDVIPLLHPELVSNGGRLSQSWLLRSVLKHADGLITTTSAASDAVIETLQLRGISDVRQQSIPLPVADAFLHRDPPDAALSQTPYFVVCGAIEPRKNHRLLLRVWQRLVQRIGPSAPRLLILGSPAHHGDKILGEFQAARELRNHVAVMSGLSTPALRTLMANARAVLMPSFAEGFGLPVIEALTVGTPILASDLPAHRESGGNLGIYLDPSDDVAWFEAISDVLENTRARERIASYQPMTASHYFETVTAFLNGFA